jgi:hypothetical protein
MALANSIVWVKRCTSCWSSGWSVSVRRSIRNAALRAVSAGRFESTTGGNRRRVGY